MNHSSPDRPVDATFAGTDSMWRGSVDGERRSSPGFQDKSLVLRSALEEYRQLRQAGVLVTPGEFSGRFPDYRKSLQRLLDVEDHLGDCGASEDPFPEIGDSFLGFDILGELGVGAIARVYLAAEPELGGRIVVIKVSSEGTAEAATLGKLQHPNIVQVYSVKRDAISGMTAVCMRYQGSATLTDVLDLVIRGGAVPASALPMLDVARQMADSELLQQGDLATCRPDPVLARGSFVDGVVHIGIQLAEALEYAHAMGVLHRDLKPSNVLLTPHGRPMLLDFNLSYDEAQETIPLGGTLPYMAPEQIRASLRLEAVAGSSGLDPRCDVFSLGVILYELLTAQLPYGGPPEHFSPQAASLWQLHAHDTPPRPVREWNPAVPAEVATVIERCLAGSPSARPATMTDLAQALRPYFRRRRRAARWLRRHPALSRSLLAAVLVPLLAAATYATLRPPLAIRQYRMAVLALENKDFNQVMALTARILHSRPDLDEARLLRGLAFEAAGNVRDAAVELERVASTMNSAAVWDHLGCCYSMNSRYADAAACFEKTIRLAPKRPEPYMKYAYSAARSPQTGNRALEYATRAVDLAPNSAEVYLVRAEVLAFQSDWPGTVADLHRAIQLAPEEAWVRKFAAERAFLSAYGNAAAEQFMIEQLHAAVELGLSRASLMQCTSYKLHQELFDGLLEKATPLQVDEKQLRDFVQPSLPVVLPAR